GSTPPRPNSKTGCVPSASVSSRSPSRARVSSWLTTCVPGRARPPSGPLRTSSPEQDRGRRAAQADLARLLPELGDASETPAAGPAQLTWLFEALLELLDRASVREPIVLLFEDVHWADEMTARWLAFAGRRLDRLRVLMAVTMRDEEVEDAPALAMALSELAG